MRKRLLPALLIAAINLIFTRQIYAQAGSLDTTFNNNKFVVTGANAPVRALTAQSDGKIIVGGSFTTYNGLPAHCLTRIYPDGVIDTSFHIGQGVNGVSNSAFINAIAVQADGKIIIGGGFTTYNGDSINGVARLNTDGSLDTSFRTGTGTGSGTGVGSCFFVNSIAIQTDGKIIIGGCFDRYNGTQSFNLARIDTDGSIDTSFYSGMPGGGYEVLSVGLQTNGKIIIGGVFFTYGGVSVNCLARLNSNGGLDNTFHMGSGPNLTVEAVIIQGDGKIIIGGGFTTYNNFSSSYLARINVDGSIDTSFQVGIGANGWVYAITLQGNGEIFIGGNFTAFNGDSVNYIAQLDSNGNLTGFNPGVGPGSSPISCLLAQGLWKIWIAGTFTSYDSVAIGYMARINADGSLDTITQGANNTVNAVAIQNDGKIVIGGAFSAYNGTSINGIARLNKDGSLDTTFVTGTGTNYNAIGDNAGWVNTLSIQSDGKIIVGGYFTYYNGTPVSSNLCRLNTDGSLDTSFHTGTDPLTLFSSAIQNDGKIIIGGQLTSYNGVSTSGIARLNTNGSLDTSFHTGTGLMFNNNVTLSVFPIRIQSDGKIIISGIFNSYNGININSFIRLNSIGTLDTTFNSGNAGPNFPISNIVIQPDGKIIIGGGFTTYNGDSIKSLARLNTNGSIDASFNPGAGNYFYDNALALMNDGKIIIGGGLARLNSNGSPDNKFNAGTGPNNILTCATLQADGEIIIVGKFTSYNGATRTGVARVLNNFIDYDSLAFTSYCSGYPLVANYLAGGGFNTGNTFTVQLSDSVGSFASPVNIGSWIDTTSGDINDTIPFNTATGNGYLLRVVSNSPPDTSNTVGPIGVHQIPVPGLCIVTVDDSSVYNIIIWEKPDSTVVDSYFVYREVTTNIYTRIASVPRDSLSEYRDYGANPNTNAYKYKLSVKDTCGIETPLSEFHNTMFLQQNGANFNWTIYSIDSVNPVSYCEIWRDTTGTGNNYALFDTISGDQDLFTDPQYSSFDSVLYYVDAVFILPRSCSPERAVTTPRSNAKHITGNPIAGIKPMQDNTFTISPNPATNAITLNFITPVSIKDIKILDLPGKTVYEENLVNLFSVGKQLYVEQLAKGIYQVVVETDKGRYVRKLIIQ